MTAEAATKIPPTLDALAVPISQLTPRKGNPRRGDIDSIAESLQRHGQYRPIVVNTRTNEVLAGNHTMAAASKLGWADIAATFVDVDEDQAARIVLADNRTADRGDYDNAALFHMLQALDNDYMGTGYDDDDMSRLEALNALPPDWQPDDTADEGTPYSRKTNAPQYEVTGDKPEVAELIDTTKAEQLLADIATAELPDDMRAFLTAAAWRHAAIRFDRVAEFYAHSDPELQRLMEASALVIIDFEDAIRQGYVTLTQRMDALREADIAAGPPPMPADGWEDEE